MSVILICEGLSGSGAVANVAWRQALGLSHQQQVLLVSDGISPERRRHLEDSQGSLEFCLVQVPRLKVLRRFAHLPRQLLWILLALRAIQEELQGARAAVICHSHPLAAAITWRFRSRVQLIMVSHGDIFHRPTGSYDPAITWLYRITTPVAHRRAAVSVALSPEMAARIQAHGVLPGRIALIPNGLNPTEIGLENTSPTPAEHWLQRPLQLLFVGRLDPIKGLEVLLSALAIGQRLGVKMHLDIVGTATEQRRQQLMQIAKQLDVELKIRWIGAVPRGSLALHYRNCHAVVVPSIDDPLPTVVLEAMACGRPVVGSSVGGIKYMVIENKTGLLIPPNDPQLLAKALERVDEDRFWLKQASEYSRERSLEFSWYKTSRKLAQVLTFCMQDDI